MPISDDDVNTDNKPTLLRPSALFSPRLLDYLYDFSTWYPAIDRVLIISWLIKDFGWMATDIYLGWPAGVISVCCHFCLLFFDPRKNFRFYNLSLLLWVTGNFLWMSVEFSSSHRSSDIHLGPPIPLGGLSNDQAISLVRLKTVLFLLASLSQCIMYVGIYLDRLPMPEDEGEDMVAKNECALLLEGLIGLKNDGAAALLGPVGRGTRSDSFTEREEGEGVGGGGGGGGLGTLGASRNVPHSRGGGYSQI